MNINLIINEVQTKNINRYLINENENADQKDPYPFSYTLNTHKTICASDNNRNLTLIAFIPSAVRDFHMRMILRNTWANYFFLNKKRMRYAFMVGLSTNENVNKMVIRVFFF